MVITIGSGKAFKRIQQSIQVNILCKIGLKKNQLKIININNKHDIKL